MHKKLQFCVQVTFIADIELHELTHAEGKSCVLYCDMTGAELQKRPLEGRFNVSKYNFHIFTPLDAVTNSLCPNQNLNISRIVGLKWPR